MRIDEIARLKKLAGIPDRNNHEGEIVDDDSESNPSVTGSKKREIERVHGIEPGTEAWFALWFNNPNMTGAQAVDAIEINQKEQEAKEQRRLKAMTSQTNEDRRNRK